MVKSIPKIIAWDEKNERIYASSEKVMLPLQDDAIELIQFNKAVEIADYLFDRLERGQ